MATHDEMNCFEVLERAIRAENALRNIRSVAEQSSFGAWRFKIAAIVDKALPNG